MGLAGASKASLGPITKALALQGAGQGHRANLIIHGLVDTPAFRKLALERAKAASVKEDVFERTVSRIPLQRAGKPEEIASAAAFICSDRLRHVNGVSLLVDGGLLYA
jgi:NAD(P)-dependent dehydrogenase (short-subunit alcohol dehydrogenase family)